MKVALSTPGKFHTLDLARELHARDLLAGVYTGYPRFKLKNEGLPAERLHTFPWLMTPYMAYPWGRVLPPRAIHRWQRAMAHSLDAWTARTLAPCDVFVGLSGSAWRTGQMQQARGGRYVCDRGSAHIRTQDELLREEHRAWGVPFDGIDPHAIEREEREYAQADRITVPSGFVMRSFIERGVPADKLRLLPYGVNLQRFEPVGQPDPNRFDVLFVGGMSLQKGIPYLLQAFARLKHPRKSLRLAGMASPALMDHLKRQGLWSPGIEVLGHVPQTELKPLMSQSHVKVLPSVQDGMGMVLAQAMACGCPVIASEHTGVRDLVDDGVEGFVVPVRSAQAIADRLQRLADEPGLRQRMGLAALARVRGVGGWRDYGDRAVAIYRELLTA